MLKTGFFFEKTMDFQGENNNIKIRNNKKFISKCIKTNIKNYFTKMLTSWMYYGIAS